MQQGALHLTWPERYGEDHFILAPCNQLAFQMIADPGQWTGHVLLLIGPAFSGKTHLAHIFAEKHRAVLVTTPEELGRAADDMPDRLVIDSVDMLIAEHPEVTEALFHLVNAAYLGQVTLLLTTRDQPAAWARLPDLLSRLQACQHIALAEPDEEMIKGAYQKLFVDRGLIVDNKVLDYMAVRSERSFSGIRRNVEMLDTLSLETARKITIPLIQTARLFEE